MPIRMTDDNDAGKGYSGNQGRHTPGGGGRGGGNIIMMILPFLFRYPKLIIPVLLIGGAFYFFRGGCSGGAANEASSSYGTGATLDPRVYDSTDVYAALSPDEQLPERVSLERFAPDAQDQGQQGSCVGWGSTYAARTILEAVNTGKNPNQVAFSPAFTYNQIGMEDCQGTYIDRAMDLMTSEGSVPYEKFPYDENSCSKQPDNYVLKEASQFRMKGANRLSISGDDYTVDVNAIRENLAHNAPVVIGMSVGGTFMKDMEGKDTWIPSNHDYDRNGFGGHCMCVLGYDDYKDEGSFLIQNSWGPKWGNNGRAWINYKDFVYFVNEAYGIYPMPNRTDQSKLSCTIALIEKETRSTIPLSDKGNNVYSTVAPMKIGTKFKVELKNNIECYVYIFGKETDNGSYQLFPYTPKHSAYCGVTGTRVFPRDKSMTPDEIGTKDYICVLVSKKALDFKTLNDKFNAEKTKDFQKRINEIIAQDVISDIRFNTDSKISFDANVSEKSIVPIIIEINKN
ncbi:MAG: cysteine protease [Bacteroidetes bacterium]|nr:cysteine protease [Bacteroidota bacterium]MDF2450708.1 cysteine protease [Bacteroidota bacterium]